MKLIKFLVGLFVSLSFFVVSTLEVGAVSPSPSPVAEVSSFDLFWPIVSGKTMGDSLYSLKILKEDFRGLLIFGASQKADYYVFLSTKRIVEAEALLKADKIDLANKTLDKFLVNLSKGSEKYKEAKSAGSNQKEKDNINKQLSNLDTFLRYLSSKYQSDAKSKIDEGLNIVHEFQSSL